MMLSAEEMTLYYQCVNLYTRMRADEISDDMRRAFNKYNRWYRTSTKERLDKSRALARQWKKNHRSEHARHGREYRARKKEKLAAHD